MARKVYLEYREGTSSKFWSVIFDGRVATVNWGKIGSRGVYQETDLIEGMRRLEEKKRKGYKVISEEIFPADPREIAKAIGSVGKAASEAARKIKKMAPAPEKKLTEESLGFRRHKRVIDTDR